MSAGTLTLTNNSASVVGNGTSFTTELTAADFIVVTVGGVSYTLPVKTVDSTTALTLVSNYTGPTQSGVAWYAVPRVAMNLVTAALVAQSAEALRGLNYDKQNWQQVLSGTGTVTIKLPDGSTYSGPAWNSFTSALGQKAEKGANSDITSLSGLTTALSVAQGGTGASTASGARTNLELGNSATKNTGTSSGTVAAGDDSRFATLDGKTGGGVTGSIYSKTISDSTNVLGGTIASTVQQTNGVTNSQFQMFLNLGVGGQRYGFLRVYQDSSYKDWYLDYSSGNAYAAAAWVNNSDRRIKENLTPITDPLGKMKKVRGYTWTRKDDQMNGAFGIGFVAQEIQEIIPQAISYAREGSLTVGGNVVEKPLALSPGDVSAALHHEAILALMEKIETLTTRVDKIEGESVTIHPGS
ncbi:tail fiber domain-containing protein [Kosakonia sacchari]|uniref:tail fiber domain-containing protein n=1 Tax=Kosakonia sacchari TaxID=1158459 RepID=UPI001363FE57|nr:tail fiber domain-containing protein [Kosakonia sacchari]QHM95980.1 tail fiber domain-containing protein [Kosakonia sacchari]